MFMDMVLFIFVLWCLCAFSVISIFPYRSFLLCLYDQAHIVVVLLFITFCISAVLMIVVYHVVMAFYKMLDNVKSRERAPGRALSSLYKL
jgi:hypothetical protein